jgi:periplasmic protein CpxP/Spy
MHARKVLAVVVLLMTSLPLAAWAQPMPPPPEPGKPVFFITTHGGMPPMPPPIIPPIMMGLQAAHLTPDQQSRVNQILQSNHSQVRPLMDQLQSVHEQIADKLLSPGTVTTSDLRQLEEQAQHLDAQIQHQALDASVQIRALLTPDQVSRMAEFQKKMSALQEQMKNLMTEASGVPTARATP